jgi:hypothetical protein
MTLNIATAEDAWLDGKAFVKEWQAEFDREWFEPMANTMMQLLWAKMPPEQHLALQQANPEMYARITQMLGGQ